MRTTTRSAALLVASLLAATLALTTADHSAAAAATPTAAARTAARGPNLLPGGGGLVRGLVQVVFEQRVLSLTNAQRRAHGCAPLRPNLKLRAAARTHSTRMAQANDMDHQLPGEAFFSTRITKAGYRSWTYVAENIARGFASPAQVVGAWMGSPGHRKNILNCSLRDLGVGVVNARGQLWWTQDFGRH